MPTQLACSQGHVNTAVATQCWRCGSNAFRLIQDEAIEFTRVNIEAKISVACATAGALGAIIFDSAGFWSVGVIFGLMFGVAGIITGVLSLLGRRAGGGADATAMSLAIVGIAVGAVTVLGSLAVAFVSATFHLIVRECQIHGKC